jgi:6-phosphofructokinase 1
MSTDSDADSAFAISQFHPVTIPTPLTSVVRFVRDSQCILLNPERLNPSAESPFPLDGKAPGSAQALSTEADAIDADIHIQLAGPRKRIFFQPQETTAGMVTCGGVCPGLNNVVRALVNILWYR